MNGRLPSPFHRYPVFSGFLLRISFTMLRLAMESVSLFNIREHQTPFQEILLQGSVCVITFEQASQRTDVRHLAVECVALR